MKINLNKRKYSFIIFLLLFLFVRCQTSIESISVNVDISQGVDARSMSGFLHYTNVYHLENNIKQLKPKYWRIGAFTHSLNDVSYLAKNNITPVIVISDLFGYPGKKNNKDWAHPLKDKKLENLLKNVYQKLGNSVIYDVWNEPYHQESSGDFDPEEFYQIFKKTHDIIRSQPGGKDAIITGPSFDHYDEKEMESFLKYCNDNGIIINILNWHEWRSGDSLEDLTKDLAKLRNVILPKYPKVKVDKIMFFEVISQYIQFSPSEILQVFKVLENNKIDGACKGCWEESDGTNNCQNNSLDGLLDNKGNPRSAWWAYKYYAQSLTNRVNSTSSYKDLVSFASFGNSQINLVLANNSTNVLNDTELSITNLNSLKFLQNLKKIKIKIFEVPETGEKILTKPLMILSKTIKVNKNIIFKIPVMKSKTVYYLVLEK